MKFVNPRFQFQREQILAEVKSEIPEVRSKSKFRCELYSQSEKSQIDSHDWGLRRTLEGYMDASQAKDRLQLEVADRERALQEDRFKGIQEIEFMRRNHEFYVDEFTTTKITG